MDCITERSRLSNMNNTTLILSLINTTAMNDVKQREYDYEGAMKFSVCIVLVYGIGVIGILGMYTHRRKKDFDEQETNAFVKTYANCKEVMARQHQISTVQNLIKSIHVDQWPASSRQSVTSLASVQSPPVSIPLTKLILRTDPSTFHKLGKRGRNSRSTSSLNITNTSDSDEAAPFISRRPGSLKYKGSFRRSEKDCCILETPETEEGPDIHLVDPPIQFTVVNVDDETSNTSVINLSDNTVNNSNGSIEMYSLSNKDTQSVSIGLLSLPKTDIQSNKSILTHETM